VSTEIYIDAAGNYVINRSAGSRDTPSY